MQPFSRAFQVMALLSIFCIVALCGADNVPEPETRRDESRDETREEELEPVPGVPKRYWFLYAPNWPLDEREEAAARAGLAFHRWAPGESDRKAKNTPESGRLAPAKAAPRSNGGSALRDPLRASEQAASFAGNWAREATVEEALGYKRNPEALETIAIKIDKQFGERWEKLGGLTRAVRETRELRGHEPVASGQISLNGFPWEAVVSHRKGSTYLTYFVPQIGGVTYRIVLIAGAGRDRDLLFIESSHSRAESREISVFKRKPE